MTAGGHCGGERLTYITANKACSKEFDLDEKFFYLKTSPELWEFLTS